MALLEPIPDEAGSGAEAPPAEVAVRLSWAFFFEEGTSKRAEYLVDLIERLRAFAAPYRFTLFKYGGTSETRYEELTKTRWAHLKDRLLRAAFDLAPGKMLALKNRHDPEPFGQIHLEVLFRTSPERLHAIYFYAPPALFGSPERVRGLLDLADQAWGALGGVHAYLNPVLAMELYHGGMAFQRACDILAANRILEVNDNFNFLPLLRDRVKGPAWGLYLGPKPTGILGGLDRVAREAPVSLVRTLPGGGCALELSEVPGWEETAETVDAYARLFEYLKPITAFGVAPLILGKALAKRGVLRTLRFATGPQAVQPGDEPPEPKRPRVAPIARRRPLRRR